MNEQPTLREQIEVRLEILAECLLENGKGKYWSEIKEEAISLIHNAYKEWFTAELEKLTALTDREVEVILEKDIFLHIQPESQAHIHRIIQQSATISQIRGLLATPQAGEVGRDE